MSEADVIARGGRPLTEQGLAQSLRAMGLASGDLALMHCALSRIGWIVGGAQTVLAAVRRVVGPTGTIAMPAHSGQLSDPVEWSNPPVPSDWVQDIRDHMPIFDPARTPLRGMGQVADAFRAEPGTLRSAHPLVSMMAQGPMAADLVALHPLDFGLGPDTPWGRLYDAGAKVLLLGAGWTACTALHQAEFRVRTPGRRTEMVPVGRRNGRTEWRQVSDVAAIMPA